MGTVRRGAQIVVAHQLILLTGLLSLGRVVANGFVSLDDVDYITSNPMVRGGLSWRGAAWAFTTFHAANWHPLTWISLQLDVGLFGLAPAGHHAVGLLLHAANALLLQRVLWSYTGRRWCGTVVALLFAVHPLRVESVAWAAERKDSSPASSGCSRCLPTGVSRRPRGGSALRRSRRSSRPGSSRSRRSWRFPSCCLRWTSGPSAG